MDNQRLFLFVALSFVILLLWQSWMEDYGPQQVPTEVTQTTTDDVPSMGGIPAAGSPDDLPGVTPVKSAAIEALPETDVLKSSGKIEVVTDMFRVQIDMKGGDLRQVDLLDYDATTEPDSEPFRLLNDSLPNLFIVQSGLRASSGTEPTHHVEYSAAQSAYTLGDGADTLAVPLIWRSPEGIEVTACSISTTWLPRWNI